ncbi:hypothetical protein ACERK3_09460 [Phycisphaerales bacterium AB-hyl4]|uniref:Uncharacterized protein n=1 Tax=Natronomicrosphaera hydrolytica TaxID=3242702 RepID=A0ABV4U5B6_9BACT
MIQDPRIVTAIAKAVEPKAAKCAAEAVPPSSVSHVRAQVAIAGTVKRGESQMARPTANLMSKAVIAELLRRMGVTQAAAVQHLRAIALEHIEAGRTDIAKALADANPELLLAVKQLEDELVNQLPKQPKPAPIRVALSVDVTDAHVN